MRRTSTPAPPKAKRRRGRSASRLDALYESFEANSKNFMERPAATFSRNTTRIDQDRSVPRTHQQSSSLAGGASWHTVRASFRRGGRRGGKPEAGAKGDECDGYQPAAHSVEAALAGRWESDWTGEVMTSRSQQTNCMRRPILTSTRRRRRSARRHCRPDRSSCRQALRERPVQYLHWPAASSRHRQATRGRCRSWSSPCRLWQP